ncbi:hypothetical protein DKL61_01125 [Gammaproteobacteria bacterium ESL0073]|nr:hypothetical protein DKL61_01125 [Gammaproteobacteria bacterium ESL0073]
MIIGGQCLVKLADTLEQLMALPLEICLQAPLIPAAGKSNTAINEDLTQQVYYLKSTHPITEFLWLYRQIDLEEMIYTYRINTLPPYCHLLLKAAPDTDLRQALNNAYQCIEGEYMYALSASLRRVLSDFMITLYQERSCCWFKAINKAYYRAEYDNFKSYTAYLKALFRKYARLLVIRVDLGYYQFVQTPYKQFMEDVDTFLKKIPFHPVFQHKVGYIWKLEYGQQKGFHVHLLLLYDGSKRRADYHIAKKIGELWQGMAPHRCLYFNCHEKTYQARYPINCLGLVTRHNEDIIKHLQNKVVDYFTKTDPYIKLFNQNTHKLSDRGQLPKAKTKNYSDKNKLTATNDHD